MGAEAFHGPVREGKGWFHLAMCTRLKLVAAWMGGEAYASCAEMGEVKNLDCDYGTNNAESMTQGYRVKPHGQLVSVSLTHCCASTPDLSTRWSSATLQGG